MSLRSKLEKRWLKRHSTRYRNNETLMFDSRRVYNILNKRPRPKVEDKDKEEDK